MLRLKLQYFGHLMQRVDSLEKTLMLGGIRGRRRRGRHRMRCWMASPTQWTWVWVNSGSWWWTGRPGVLRFMGSQRVGHDWATEVNWKQPLQYNSWQFLTIIILKFLFNGVHRIKFLKNKRENFKSFLKFWNIFHLFSQSNPKVWDNFSVEWRNIMIFFVESMDSLVFLKLFGVNEQNKSDFGRKL